MDHRNEVRQLLASRRARITPEQAGLPAFGANRRVAGLRPEEVAPLAGVGVDSYTRLERGNLHGVSESVLEALAQALQLDEAERAYLFDLARAETTPTRRRRATRQRIRPSVQRVLDAMTGAPAYVRNGRADILAANRLGYALLSEMFSGPARSANTARFVFLDPRATSSTRPKQRRRPTKRNRRSVSREEAMDSSRHAGKVVIVTGGSKRHRAGDRRWARERRGCLHGFQARGTRPW
jgi:transcriptional regulator with XRE-family HTH domain